MDDFKPFLLAGLKNTAEYQVCRAAVELVGVLARSLQDHIISYTGEIMEVLFNNLNVSVACTLPVCGLLHFCVCYVFLLSDTLMFYHLKLTDIQFIVY